MEWLLSPEAVVQMHIKTLIPVAASSQKRPSEIAIFEQDFCGNCEGSHVLTLYFDGGDHSLVREQE